MPPSPTLLYFDHASTTPCDERVVAAMLPFFSQRFANPASRHHAPGLDAADAVETARRQVASMLGGDARGVVFTSGATESNNLALQGIAGAAASPGHIITAAHEHPSVLAPIRRLAEQGWSVTTLDPGRDGIITSDMVAAALRPQTALVSIMWANNEIGTINEVPAIGQLCRERGVPFHSDAAQWTGKMPVDLDRDRIDLLSLSAHKFGGPKGAGALILRRGGPRLSLRPLVEGGGQERGLRSGTLNVPAIVGLGEACRIASEEMAQESRRLGQLRDRLDDALLGRVPGTAVNGDRQRRIPFITSLRFEGVTGEGLMLALAGLACSTGSACSSGHTGPSHVLTSLGLTETQAGASIRLSLGRTTTMDQVDAAAEQIAAAVSRLRRLAHLGAAQAR